MRLHTFLVTVLACLCGLSVALLSGPVSPAPDAERYWPQWRGPAANGVAPLAEPPLEWSENKNLAWKVEIPGKGHSSPIVWGDRIFVSTAIATGEGVAPVESNPPPDWMPGVKAENRLRFTLLALNRKDGRVVWQKVAREGQPHAGTHRDGSWASASPVSDGEVVCVFFGSQGLYCYDLHGRPLWETDLGDMRIKLGFGEGSSPVLHGDYLIVNWDHEDQSFIVALDKRTGKQIWRTDRDETTSWSTPHVVTYNGKTQVVVNATTRVRSYDLESGRLLWESSGMTDNVIPSPVSGDGVVYVTSGFRGSSLQAIQLNKATRDVSVSGARLWQYDRDTPYVPSPLLYRGLLYFLKSNNAILTCLDAATGSQVYELKRLEGISGVYASPVAAQDRVYIVGREGTTQVLRHGREFEVLAVNSLEDRFDASPALVDREIYLRGHRYLYRISEE